MDGLQGKILFKWIFFGGTPIYRTPHMYTIKTPQTVAFSMHEAMPWRRYSVAMMACSQGSHWNLALQLLEEMSEVRYAMAGQDLDAFGQILWDLCGIYLGISRISMGSTWDLDGGNFHGILWNWVEFLWDFPWDSMDIQWDEMDLI